MKADILVDAVKKETAKQVYYQMSLKKKPNKTARCINDINYTC